jgi:hypothetical protein
MPVRKFRSVDQMPESWLDRDDPRLLEAIRTVWNRAARLAPYEPRPGVRKYRTMEEANADREAVLARRIQRLRAARKQEG